MIISKVYHPQKISIYGKIVFPWKNTGFSKFLIGTNNFLWACFCLLPIFEVTIFFILLEMAFCFCYINTWFCKTLQLCLVIFGFVCLFPVCSLNIYGVTHLSSTGLGASNNMVNKTEWSSGNLQFISIAFSTPTLHFIF